MKFDGAIHILRAWATAALRKVSRWLLWPSLSVAWLADRCEPGGDDPREAPPREWKPRLWARTGGRTANESRD